MNKSETAFCPHCGHHLNIIPDGYFCQECGVKIPHLEIMQYDEVIDLRAKYDAAARAEAE